MKNGDVTFSANAHYAALRNTLNSYGAMSQAYLVSSSYGNKDDLQVAMMNIPSIFYGSKIKPGSVSLKWMYTGSLVGELQDENQNGELIQVGPVGSEGSGNVAGVVLYNEGIVLLTGAYDMGNYVSIGFPESSPYTSGTAFQSPTWVNWGAGANDNTPGGFSLTLDKCAFQISFKGITETQVMTMFAHAKRGEVNYSNNPTYLEYGQEKIFITSSTIYQENVDIKLKNFVSSSYLSYDAPFKRQVFISQIGIYDSNKNLIGVATLGTPVLKEDDQAYTFKLKLDI